MLEIYTLTHALPCQATAAAPISKETLEYFLSLGIPIYEVFGMSECTGPHVRACDVCAFYFLVV